MIDRNHPIGSNRRQSYLCRSHRLGPSDSAATDAGGDHVRRCITLAAPKTHPADELAQALQSPLPKGPESLHAWITERAEGNPFFTSRLVNGLIDPDVIQTDGPVWQLLTERPRAQAPSSGLAAVGAEGLQRRQFMQSATWFGPRAA